MCDGLLSDRQVWQIQQPFAFTPDEQAFLFENPITEASMWYDPMYQPIKNRIREHYLQLQNCTCAYCRLPIHGGTDNIEIEHIVDKNRRLDYVFEPLNLVVSCHNCNFKKSTSRVLHQCPDDLDDYPTDPAAFEIIHGHFDDYFENIQIIASAYHALEDKGEFTIETCKLGRIPLVEQREVIEMYFDDPIIARVVALRRAGNNEALLDDILNQLNNPANQ